MALEDMSLDAEVIGRLVAAEPTFNLFVAGTLGDDTGLLVSKLGE